MKFSANLEQSPLISGAKQYYQGLQPREQTMLRWMSLFLAVVAAIWLVILPAWDYSQSAQKRFATERDNLIWMSQNAGKIGQTSSASGGRTDILSSVVGSARENQIAINRYEPSGENSLKVWLENVEFNAAYFWLASLQSEHGVRAEEILLERAQSKGYANLRLSLTAGN